MSTSERVFGAVTAMLLMAVAPASGQTATGPPGSVRGIFGGQGGPPNPARTTQQWSAWIDFGGGHDRNEDISGSASTVVIEGAATAVQGSMRYWRGRTTRSFEVNARAFRNAQMAAEAPAVGGEGSLSGVITFGRRVGLTGSVRGANESAVLFGAFGPSQSTPVPDVGIDDPGVAQPQGNILNRWWSFVGDGSAFYSWTPRQRTTTQVSRLRRLPSQGQDNVEIDQFVASLRHEWTLSPSRSLQGTYRLERIRQSLPSAPVTEPTVTQTAEGGLLLQRRLSASRTLSFSALGGATQIVSTPGPGSAADGAFSPTGSVTATYSLLQRLILAATATRTVTVLQGVDVLPFTNDVGTLTLTTLLSRRWTVMVSGVLSQGRSVGDAPGTFDAYGGSATVRYGVRYGGVFVGYTRYEHRLNGLPNPVTGISPVFNQESLRAGVTLWLPLFGAF